MTTSQPAIPITSFEEVRQQWQELLGRSVVNNLYITPTWQELWWSAFQNGRSLAGFYLTDAAGQLTALASLSRCGDNFSFVGNSDTFDYNDFVIARGAEPAFFPALLDEIDSGGGRQLDLYSVGEDSPTLAMLPDLARERGYAVDIAEEDVAPRIDLPATWDDYLAGLSKKDRHELRRKLRRLEGHENWRWFCVSDPGEASARTDTFLELMRSSDPAKAEFLTADREDFFRKLIATTAGPGSSAALLHGDGLQTRGRFAVPGLRRRADAVQQRTRHGIPLLQRRAVAARAVPARRAGTRLSIL